MLSTRAAVVLQEQVAFGQAGNRENSKRTSILLAFMFPDFEGQDAEPVQFFFEEDLYLDVVCILMDLQYRGSRSAMIRRIARITFATASWVG